MKCKCGEVALAHNAWKFNVWFVYCPTCGNSNQARKFKDKELAEKDWIESNGVANNVINPTKQ